MDVQRTTVPGRGVLYHCHTRGGARFALLANTDGNKDLLIYGIDDTDEPERRIRLEPDEADQLADLLRSSPLPDRIAHLERRLDRLARQRERS